MKHFELTVETKTRIFKIESTLGNINFMEFHKYLLILINFVIKWVQTISEGYYDSVKS